MSDEELALIDMRYGSRSAPPWSAVPKGNGYLVRSYGGNDIIAIKHYAPHIAQAVLDVVLHAHEDVGKLLAEIDRLKTA